MYCWQITKYNPRYRNARGAYLLDEWTDYSCVGMVIDNKKISFEEYESIERKYIQAVKLFMKNFKVDSFRFAFFQKNDFPFDEHTSKDMKTYYNDLSRQTVVRSNMIEDALRLALRGYIDVIFIQSDVVIKFGYDYYMMIGATRNCPEILKEIEDFGLYPEEKEYYYYIGQFIEDDDLIEHPES